MISNPLPHSASSFPAIGATAPGPTPFVTSAVSTDESQPLVQPAPPLSLRALHLVNGEHFSGAERVQSHLARCLPRFGVAADFVCVKPGRFAEMLDQGLLSTHETSAAGAGQGTRNFRLPMRHRLDLRPAWQIRQLARQENFDLLHAHTPRTAMIAAVASQLTGLPWVYHVHSPTSRDSNRAWINRLNAWIERRSLACCSHLITVSNSLRRDCLQAGFSAEQVTVVHNGVPAIRPPRTRIPEPGSRWTLGMVALMRPRKGLEVALDAVAQLRAAGHDVALRCIGPFETPGYAAEITARIERLGIAKHVEQIGFTGDVPDALARLDALVLPSLYGEGLPMVVLEAMAAAVPVIATRVEGTPEAIEDGVEGLLAEPGSATSLATKIESLVTGEYDWTSMAEAAHQRHAKSFSDQAMAQGVANVYRHIACRRTP